MNSPRSNPYIQDILSQPEALSRTLERLPGVRESAEIAAHATGRLVLTGMGASFHALLPLYYTLVRRGHDVHLVETSELVHSLLPLITPGTAVVATSQSGRSAEIVALLAAIPSKTTVIGVTNTGDGPLAAAADAVILTSAGEEHSVSSKTYTTALVALEWLGRILTGSDARRVAGGLESVVSPVDAYLREWDRSVDEMMGTLGDSTSIMLVGRGASLASTGMGALIVREASHVVATGMSGAAYRHGPIDMASSREFVFAFAGDGGTMPLMERLVDDVRSYGGLAGLVHADERPGTLAIPAGPPWMAPVLEILPTQVLTVALAARSGRSAGEFSHIGKVTAAE